jgi:hypothetical protein
MSVTLEKKVKCNYHNLALIPYYAHTLVTQKKKLKNPPKIFLNFSARPPEKTLLSSSVLTLMPPLAPERLITIKSMKKKMMMTPSNSKKTPSPTYLDPTEIPTEMKMVNGP